MYKIFRYTMMMALAATVLMGCEDEDAVRVPELREGASLRVVFPDPDLTFFNFDEPESARLLFDMYTENRNIDSVNIYVSYFNNIEGTTSDTVLLKTFRQSDFNNGQLRGATITLAEATSVLGLGFDDLAGQDRFDFFNEVVLTDGRKYPQVVDLPAGYNDSNTLVPGIANRSIATGSFNAGFVANVACPVPEGYAVGRYRLVQTGTRDPFSAANPAWRDAEVNITQTTPIGRTFTSNYLGFAGIRFNFTLVCNNLIVPQTSSGLACAGNPAFIWVTAPEPGTYDTASDETIVLQVRDNISGACGITTPGLHTITLTRVQ